MGVRELPLLALALSLGGPASAADHGLKSVRIQAEQGFDYELLEEYGLAATAHRSKAETGPLELPSPYALQTVEQVKSTSTQFKGGRKKPLAKGTVVYMQGKNGELEGKVVRDLRPARQSIEVRWSTGGRLVTLPIEAGKRELLIMRESKRKGKGQANAKITGHVGLLPPSGVVRGATDMGFRGLT